MTPEIFQVLLPALMAGILILSTHIVLGQQVLKRGIIFIDLAIAQVAALGTVLVHVNHHLQALPLADFWMPALFAILAAGVIAWLEQHMAAELEAMIGCFYVLAAVSAILMLSQDPHGGELLKRLLSGQILWIDWDQIGFLAMASFPVLLSLYWCPTLLAGKSFYLVFALMVTLSVKLVGVYLVFSSLILPALATYRLNKYALPVAYLNGILGYIIGLGLSTRFDLPAGAAIVASLTLCTIAFRFLFYTFQKQNCNIIN